jgi:hypothetical protein
MGTTVNATTDLPLTVPPAARADVDAPEEMAARERLIQLVEQLLRESGNTEPFDAAAWIDRWLRRPNHALGGATPELYLHTTQGEALLSGLIGAMAAGSYL